MMFLERKVSKIKNETGKDYLNRIAFPLIMGTVIGFPIALIPFQICVKLGAIIFVLGMAGFSFEFCLTQMICSKARRDLRISDENRKKEKEEEKKQYEIQLADKCNEIIDRLHECNNEINKDTFFEEMIFNFKIDEVSLEKITLGESIEVILRHDKLFWNRNSQIKLQGNSLILY